jgi:recombinational DNA repair ATPase RecF
MSDNPFNSFDYHIKALDEEIISLSAKLATARRDALEEAARRLEELHKNHKYNPQTGEGSEHDAGYYRALSEGAAWILALKGEGHD